MRLETQALWLAGVGEQWLERLLHQREGQNSDVHKPMYARQAHLQFQPWRYRQDSQNKLVSKANHIGSQALGVIERP